MSGTPVEGYSYSTLMILHAGEHIVECRLNRPAKLNTFTAQVFEDFKNFFADVATDDSVRCIVLTGEGKHFTAGLDLNTAGQVFGGVNKGPKQDAARKGVKIRRIGKDWQTSMSNIEKCGKPVIACVHGVCLGAGVELLSATDMRVCCADTKFSLAEINIALAADIGGLQRFPKAIGSQAVARELAFTGRNFSAEEALQWGWVSKVLPDRAAVRDYAFGLAKTIASKSPVAVLGVKTFLNYTRDHSVDESLEYAITWNQGMLQCDDLGRAAAATLMKKKVVFEDLSKPKPKPKL
eukprot:Hpha_TRINITY_DN15420_c1_g1::TRINITY_DN15420_c1_g1_i3::g.176898::m.176898/K12663/ECH1; Delta(3,5)-Delta(2,4)-dienoyl-CoA isomerase